ncbi:MAG: dicarboxylate/amino acid:cation symporter, partial [Ignavibacteria bacterium CHB3]|nr:dicarboxylate/amino acid:cation symporter [Ignavibacteria bacterium CHB3]
MKLHSKILLGLLIGLILGLSCNLFVTDKDLLKWIVENISYPIGQIFIRMIFMIVIPLIFTAIVLGLADFRDIHKIGVVGLKTLMFTIVITAVSVIIGLVIVNLVQPGTGISPESRTELMNSLTSNQSVSSIIKTAEESKSFVQIILDLIPRNPFVDIVYAFDPNYRGGGLLALMFFSLIFGIAMAMSPQEKIQGLTFTLQGIYDVLMKIIGYAMKLAPIGVAGLIFSTTSQLGFKIVSILSLYVLAVLAALAIHFLVTYGVIIKYALKKNPVEFFKQISEVMITAFSTSSSNATLPTTIRNSIDNLKIDKDIANFVLTVGSTANQNGTA